MMDTLKPTSRIGHPFKNKEGKAFTDPMPAYAGLALANGGHYPLGTNGLFHGGIHFSAATANAFDQGDGVRCLADGEIVAYRLDSQYPDATPATEKSSQPPQGPALRPYSTGFVLVRHRLQPPAPPVTPPPSEAPTITRYGARLAARPGGPSVGWLPLGTEVAMAEERDGWVRVAGMPPEQTRWLNGPVANAWLPVNALDSNPSGFGLKLASLTGQTVYGKVTVPCTPDPGQVRAMQDFQAAQAEYRRQCEAAVARPTLTFYSLYMHLADGASYATYPERPRPVWWNKLRYRAGAKSRDLTAYTPRLVGLNIRQQPKGEKLGLLTRGSCIEVDEHSSDRKWGRISRIVEGNIAPLQANAQVSTEAPNGWVFLKELEEEREPEGYDRIICPREPIPVAAGALLGHLGEDTAWHAPLAANRTASSPLLHLEVFSADDVPRFIDACRQWERHLPENQHNLLALNTGDELRGEPKADGEVIATLQGPQTLPLSGLKSHKDEAGKAWRQVKARTGPGTTATGWVEETGRRCSPWRWRGFQVLDATSPPGGSWWEDANEFVNYLRGGPRPKESEFVKRLRGWLDTNKDGKLDETELDNALRDQLLAPLLGGVIAYHESEWHVPSWESKYGMLDKVAALLGPLAQRNLEAEKPRVSKLQWWTEVALQVGLPQDARVYHFHPVGLAGCFQKDSCCEITVEFLEEVLGKTGDWFTGKGGGKRFEENYKDNYPDVYKFNKGKFVELLNLALERYSISSCDQKAHFLSQCFHESAHFESTIEFASGNQYNPGVHPDAIKNGNTEMGDGPKFKGKGLIQLTWKNNYKRYSEHRGIDFVSSPELIASNMYNSIDASCWYWRHNGAIYKKHNAKGDINKLVDAEKENVGLITLAVNGGNRGLRERELLFSKIKQKWNLK
ncbi:glycoside hydrolase family 19 protein [Zestomonas carbonaria]|uniref:EF-hand domain-containing protein n=1 Tax=Zestomonas carbonaria TaxID=2762745 RepID=A0A7U7ETS8_9GAMM|nr:glycoside hydrolase family 19 protein [Pseudomonas carbonaria]CAD5110600.1 hypothetical protein PSEWESI4_04923 [Pseudomonas carbonaria]